MRITGLGRILFALALAALGAFIVALPDFAKAWPPLPAGVPDPLTLAAGALLLIGGLALLIPRTTGPAALALAAFLLLRILVMKVPVLFAHPLLELAWYDVSENLVLVAGAWTIFAIGSGNAAYTRIGQILFALAMPALGLSHFFYVEMTAPLIPSWLPFHIALAYVTGAAHIAAGVGILFGIVPRLAATLEAVMVSLFTLLVWVPRVIGGHPDHGTLAEICISTAIAGAAWAVAESLRGRAWRFKK